MGNKTSWIVIPQNAKTDGQQNKKDGQTKTDGQQNKLGCFSSKCKNAKHWHWYWWPLIPNDNLHGSMIQCQGNKMEIEVDW